MLSLVLAAPVAAQERSRSDTPSPASGVPADSVTHRRFKAGGMEAAFTVTAGSLPLEDTKGERQASMFYIAYTRDGAAAGRQPSLSPSTAGLRRASSTTSSTISARLEPRA